VCVCVCVCAWLCLINLSASPRKLLNGRLDQLSLSLCPFMHDVSDNVTFFLFLSFPRPPFEQCQPVHSNKDNDLPTFSKCRKDLCTILSFFFFFFCLVDVGTCSLYREFTSFSRKMPLKIILWICIGAESRVCYQGNMADRQPQWALTCCYLSPSKTNSERKVDFDLLPTLGHEPANCDRQSHLSDRSAKSHPQPSPDSVGVLAENEKL
jgi:hypothetical protein